MNTGLAIFLSVILISVVILVSVFKQKPEPEPEPEPEPKQVVLIAARKEPPKPHPSYLPDGQYSIYLPQEGDESTFCHDNNYKINCDHPVPWKQSSGWERFQIYRKGETDEFIIKGGKHGLQCRTEHPYWNVHCDGDSDETFTIETFGKADRYVIKSVPRDRYCYVHPDFKQLKCDSEEPTKVGMTTFKNAKLNDYTY